MTIVSAALIAPYRPRLYHEPDNEIDVEMRLEKYRYVSIFILISIDIILYYTIDILDLVFCCFIFYCFPIFNF